MIFPLVPVCNNGTWNIAAHVVLIGKEYVLKTDTLSVNGGFNLTFNTDTTLSLQVDPHGVQRSGRIIVSGHIIMKGTVNVNFTEAPITPDDADRPAESFTTVLMIYGSRDLANQFTVSLPLLPKSAQYCEIVDSTTPTYGPTSFSITTSVSKTEGINCQTGKGDRSWVLILIIVSSVHGVLLVLFCLITCKNSDLKEKIWELGL